MHSYRIVLADDHKLIRRGIKKIIEERPGLEVVGEAGDGRELLSILGEVAPDLAIVDMSMPEMGGLEAIKKIKTGFPDVKVLVLTMHTEKDYLLQALSAGADGYLLKEDADVELYSAIKAIQGSGNYISPLLAGKIAGSLVQMLKENNKPPEKSLTGREGEILKHIAEGKSSREIAENLGISVRTVENHRFNIMRKLDFKKNIQLVRYAIDHGYIPNGKS